MSDKEQYQPETLAVRAGSVQSQFFAEAGDHIVASRGIFGATIDLFNNIIKKFGVETTYVSAADTSEWHAAVRPNILPGNAVQPAYRVSGIVAIAAVAKGCGALLAVDNCFRTPILQRPLDLGADIIIQSATRYIDGQGRVPGGAVLGSRKLMGPVFGFLRTASTTHGRIAPEARAAAGISDGLIRIAAGLEAAVDIQNDLARSCRAPE